MRRLFILACVLGFALPALAQQPAPPAAPMQRMTLLLDWFINPDHGPIFVALENGYFRDAGLEMEIIAPSDPADPPRLVAAGRADLGISYQPQVTIAAANGIPLTRIATLIATPLNTVIALESGPVRTLADLRGRRVGYSAGGFESAILGAMLERAGVRLNEVTLINVNFALSQALLAGQVDAVVGGYRNFELNQLAIEGRPGRAFYPELEGVPVYDELVVVARRDRARDPAMRRFVDAIERGALFLVNNPDAAWNLFIRGPRANLNDELNRRAWRDTAPRFTATPAAFDRLRYERFAEFLRARGLITAAPRIEDYVIEPR